MATLDTAQREAVWQQIMKTFSAATTEVPITKTQLLALVGLIDDGLNEAEQSILADLPAGDGKDWLVAHPGVSRQLVVMVEQQRQKEL